MSATGFWAAVFLFAFAAFTVVSALIAVKGVGEIRELFRHLEARRPGTGDGAAERRQHDPRSDERRPDDRG